jgi:hypothetical protein
MELIAPIKSPLSLKKAGQYVEFDFEAFLPVVPSLLQTRDGICIP